MFCIHIYIKNKGLSLILIVEQINENEKMKKKNETKKLEKKKK